MSNVDSDIIDSVLTAQELYTDLKTPTVLRPLAVRQIRPVLKNHLQRSKSDGEGVVVSICECLRILSLCQTQVIAARYLTDHVADLHQGELPAYTREAPCLGVSV